MSCVAYRSPVLLARMAADIDAISHGHLVLGLGSGDMPCEFQQLGLAYSTIQELVDVGFQYFVCTISGNDVETLTLLAQQVIPNIVA